MSKRIVIDGERFNNIEEFYCEVDRVLTRGLSWETGHNLDAFNDLLCGGFGVHEYGEKLEIQWINAKKSKNNLGYKATAEYYRQLMQKCHPDNIEYIKTLLLEAEAQKGETLMDMIVNIILDSDNSGHNCTLKLVD